MMKYAVSRITLDIQDTSSPITLNAKQGDTMREIICGFREGSGQYYLDRGCAIVFTAQKPSGKRIYNECIVEGNFARYQFTAQTVSEIGPLKCEFKIYDDLSKPPKLTSPRFVINVEEPVFNDGDIPESSYEFLAVQDIVKKTTVEYLGNHPTITDATLTKEDFAADAKAVGDALKNMLPKSGGVMSGDLSMGGNRVTGLGAPEDLGDAATKAYADGKTQFFSVTLSAQGWED
ncbi:MAG: BppU family phage baseplate upper protein, partial [Faecousia sp.]